MNILLLLALRTLFFVEEPSYNFGGRFPKDGTVRLTISVQDESYWATFTTADSTCKVSAKASVKKGILYSQIREGKKPITLLISATNYTNTIVVREVRKNDRSALNKACINSNLYRWQIYHTALIGGSKKRICLMVNHTPMGNSSQLGIKFITR